MVVVCDETKDEVAGCTFRSATAMLDSPMHCLSFMRAGETPPGARQGDKGSQLPPTKNRTRWVQGQAAEVGWMIAANHGGGYGNGVSRSRFLLPPASCLPKVQVVYQSFGATGLHHNNTTLGQALAARRRGFTPVHRLPLPAGTTTLCAQRWSP